MQNMLPKPPSRPRLTSRSSQQSKASSIKASIPRDVSDYDDFTWNDSDRHQQGSPSNHSGGKVRAKAKTKAATISAAGGSRGRTKSAFDLRGSGSATESSGSVPPIPAFTGSGATTIAGPSASRPTNSGSRPSVINGNEWSSLSDSTQLLRRCSSDLDLAARDGILGVLDDEDIKTNSWIGNRSVGDKANGKQNGQDEDEEDEGHEREAPYFMVRPPSVMSTNSRRSSTFGIRVTDSSDRPSMSFATEISIPKYSLIGEKNAGGYIVYECLIVTKDGMTFRADKRYSAFVELQSSIHLAFPNLKKSLPKLPPKNALSKFRPSFLERRRRALAFWLASVLLHPDIGGSSVARRWILD